jgi:hypothetical protein
MTLLSLFSGCQHRIETYAKESPSMSIKEFFTGKIKAWGIVQNWKGEVTRRFTVDMNGSWQGDTGTLEEAFLYNDGEKQSRVWTITKLPDGVYEGRAADILDKAVGETNGNAARWNYAMNLAVGDSTYHVRFDDWMWQLDEKTLMNRSYIKKFGITVAELTIFMQKE